MAFTPIYSGSLKPWILLEFETKKKTKLSSLKSDDRKKQISRPTPLSVVSFMIEGWHQHKKDRVMV